MKPSSSCFPTTTAYLLLVPLGLITLVLVLASLGSSHLRSDGLGVLCPRPAAAAERVEQAAPEPEFRLLVGVLTTAKRFERRNVVRLAYSLQLPVAAAQVDVRFVLCNVTDPVDAALVAIEIMRYDDIIVLDCAENMNQGKTHTYFSSVPRLFVDRPYDYVMKTDDDTYLRVGAMVGALRGKPREDVYIGHGFAVGDDPMPFMHGMGYVVSWDVATWVSTNEEILKHNDTTGPEDLLFGKWLNIGKKGKNRYNLKPWMYDLNWDMDNFRPDTVAVHLLKDNRRWAAAFRYFNVTAGTKPSKLYRSP